MSRDARMNQRKYKKCEWCGKTIDTTNNCDDLCSACAEYDTKIEMLKAKTQN